jgi:tight adherence protein B
VAVMIAILTFLSTLLIAAGIYLARSHSRHQQALQERLRRAMDLPEPTANPIVRYRQDFNADSDLARMIAPQLGQAGLSITPFDWYSAQLGVIVLMTLLLMRAFSLEWGWSLTIAAILVPVGARYLLRMRRGSHSHAVGRQLPEAVRLIGNSLHAGLSIRQGLARAGQELPPPLGPIIRRAVREMQLGTSLEETLDHLTTRVDNRDLQFVVTTILLQHEVGGDLAGALEQIAAALTERLVVDGEVETATAEQRYVAMILPIVPIAGLFLLNVGHPGYIQVLFRPLGLLLLGASVVLQVFGFLLIHRAARIKV